MDFMYLSRFPRLFFAHLPTPIEPLRNLSKKLGGANLWIKRDDCTGLAGGGNKTRKLEFLFADAITQKADIVITQGAVQSNHCRQTAAVAAQLGMPCHVLLEDRINSEDKNYRDNGNVLFSRLFGAQVSYFAANTDMNVEMQNRATEIKKSGKYKNPYIIPGGGSNAIGALGYVNAVIEILHQVNAMNLQIHHIVHATGSTGTQAGLLAGLHGVNANIPLLGISVRLPKQKQEENVFRLATETAKLLNIKTPIPREQTQVNDCFVGKGYGIPADDTLEAIRLTAESEGILLDPVYSGKGMAGLIAAVHEEKFSKCDNVLFVHTGGAQALPGYLDYF